MTASSYGRGKTRATKKSRVAKAKPTKREKRAVKPKKAVAKALTRKHAAKRRSAVTTERTRGEKRLRVGQKAVKARSVGRGGTSSSVKKPKARAKARPKAKPEAKPRPKTRPKRRGAVARPKTLTPAQKGARTRARRKAEREAIARRLTKLAKDRAKLRNKSEKGKRSLRQKLNARLKDIARRALERKLVTEKLPRKTPRQKKQSREELYERHRSRFYELHELAKQKNQLPKVDYRERRIRSDKNDGDVRILRIETEVTESTIEQIMYEVKATVKKMSGTFPIWMGVVVFTGMGERLIGYGNRVLDASDPDASQFQTQGIESTGILPHATAMLMSIETILTDYASEEYTVVYCEHIKLLNFKRINGR